MRDWWLQGMRLQRDGLRRRFGRAAPVLLDSTTALIVSLITPIWDRRRMRDEHEWSMEDRGVGAAVSPIYACQSRGQSFAVREHCWTMSLHVKEAWQMLYRVCVGGRMQAIATSSPRSVVVATGRGGGTAAVYNSGSRLSRRRGQAYYHSPP